MSYLVTVDSKDLLLIVTAANESRRKLSDSEARTALTLAIQRTIARGNAAFKEAHPANALAKDAGRKAIAEAT